MTVMVSLSAHSCRIPPHSIVSSARISHCITCHSSFLVTAILLCCCSVITFPLPFRILHLFIILPSIRFLILSGACFCCSLLCASDYLSLPFLACLLHIYLPLPYLVGRSLTLPFCIWLLSPKSSVVL